MSAVTRATAVCLAIATLCVACSAAPRVGGVRVVSNVPEATLYVDEEVQGQASVYEHTYIRLAPGPHRLMLEHPEYFPEYVDVDVPENMAMAVRVEMRRRPE